jgi:hypothetical protein
MVKFVITVDAFEFGLTIRAATTCAPLKFINFEYLFSLRCTFHRRVINFINATFVVHNFIHLFFRDKPTMISESIFSQILSAVISNMIFVHSLLLFLPISDHFCLSLFNRQNWAFVWNHTRWSISRTH